MRSRIRFSRIAAGLAFLAILDPSASWAQNGRSLEPRIEFGGMMSSVDPATAALEGVRRIPYGPRIGGSLAQGWMVVAGDIAALSFPREESTGGEPWHSDRYRVSAYLASVSVGARAPQLRIGGPYRLVGGLNLGSTWMSASRKLRGRPGLSSSEGALPGQAIPEPEIRSGLFLEPAVQLLGKEVGAALRYRVYDLSSTLHHEISLTWSIDLGARRRAR